MIKRSKELFILISILTISATVPASTGTVNTAFSINMNLFAMITVAKVQDLIFSDATLTGSAFNITVATGASGAASFNATGTNNRSITRSVVQSSVNMTATGVTGTIAVDTFVLAGPTAFDASGNANGLKVGATAHVLATSEDGNYSGSGTFRIVYQ